MPLAQGFVGTRRITRRDCWMTWHCVTSQAFLMLACSAMMLASKWLDACVRCCLITCGFTSATPSALSQSIACAAADNQITIKNQPFVTFPVVPVMYDLKYDGVWAWHQWAVVALWTCSARIKDTKPTGNFCTQHLRIKWLQSNGVMFYQHDSTNNTVSCCRVPA